MELKQGGLKVFYKGKVDVKLDEALRKCLEKFGYKEWASGYCVPDDVRDLAFDKKGG